MLQTKRKPRQVQLRRGANLFDKPPKITVIVTARTAGVDAVETIESAMKQKFREHEVIVAVGRSEASDELGLAAAARVEELVLVKQRGGTEATSRFAALAHARGEIVAFLTSGDVWNPEFLAAQMIHLERGGFDLVYGDAAVTGAKTAYRRSFLDSNPYSGTADFANLLIGECSILTSSVLVRRKNLETIAMAELPAGADADRFMWLELAASGAKIGCNRQQLLRYREAVQPETTLEDSYASEREILPILLESPSLGEAHRAAVESRLSRIESRLAEERGISLLRTGENAEALSCLRDAVRYEPTFKLSAVTWLAGVAPKAALFLADTGRVRHDSAPPQYGSKVL